MSSKAIQELAGTDTFRLVVVDDADPAISFSGTWDHDATIPNIQEDQIVSIPAFNNTATFSQTNASFTITFVGTGITVIGSINFDTSDAFGSCIVDGNDGQDPNSENTISRARDDILCIISNIPDGTHTLAVSLFGLGATVPGIIVLPGDSQLKYSSTWGNELTQTTQNNASVTFTFQGMHLRGCPQLVTNSSDSPFDPSSASYSIDGRAPNIVSIIGQSATNTPLFQSGILPEGEHTLTVIYQGSDLGPPLTLDHLVVVPVSSSPPSKTSTTTTTAKHGSSITNLFSSSTTSAFGTSTPEPSNTSLPTTSFTGSSPQQRSSTATIKIIGTILGVVVALLLISILLYLRCRRRQKQYPYITSVRHMKSYRHPRHREPTQRATLTLGPRSRESSSVFLASHHLSAVSEAHRWAMALDLPWKHRI
ncbi:hypothetical protein BDN70DRAFT_997017 [Pholiota conissans]|uniref:Uncharacterized protein n=1 Tax=Pholiota conissans TaxID=109636 RepID=A0A9P6CV56_9AGAR|nr:hypothetical protein BDN70DRAFT_997017 [Pholiota conissans]